jgi:hypothetical protein
MYDDFRVKASVAPPISYVVPAQWQDAIDVIRMHGISMETIHNPQEFEVESYRFENLRWPEGPFEGRLMPSYSVEVIRERRNFPGGSVIIPVAQVGARVLMNLLEPEAPDSLARWGFFNATFEQKEYGEHYVLEKLAREMLATNPKLKEEFEKRVAAEPEFASSPAQRLHFFYHHSPYWDPQMNLYPVGRILTM